MDEFRIRKESRQRKLSARHRPVVTGVVTYVQREASRKERDRHVAEVTRKARRG